MKNLMFVENKEEAEIVESLFAQVCSTLNEGKTHRDARGFDEANFVDGRGESFSDYPNEHHHSAAYEAGVIGAFPNGELVRIPYGALVYVYRHIGGGDAVYDVYSFGYRDKFAMLKDIEGDLAGLANLSTDFFPNI